MLDISGHLRSYRDEMGFEDLSKPLIINCCGYQKFMMEDFPRIRPNGRNDYQLIYMHKGMGHFIIDREEKVLGAGTFIFFRPNESQHYTYYAKEQPEVYWIHFTGADCERLIESFSFTDIFVGENVQFKTIFQDIILELQLQKPYFEEVINSNFIKLLALIQRMLILNEKTKENHFAMDRLIIALNQQYTKQWTISTMADFCNMSNDYFSHIFKEVTHVTPINFLTKLRIAKSKELLLAEGLGISDVAFLVGYADPLYFSRVFKKMEKVSPKEYRAQVLALQTPFTTQ